MPQHDLEPVGEFTIDADHPCVSGHFPGNPVVPGVVVLDHALALVAGLDAGVDREAVIPRVKFTGFVRPGERVRVSGARTAGGLLFRCDVDGRPVAQGRYEPAS